MSIPDSTTLYEKYGLELAEFVEMVRTGKAFSDQAAAERLTIRLVGALMHLHAWHRVDGRGWCSTCWRIPNMVAAVAETHHLHGV